MKYLKVNLFKIKMKNNLTIVKKMKAIYIKYINKDSYKIYLFKIFNKNVFPLKII